MSFGKSKEKAGKGITETGERVYQAAKATPQEEAQYGESFKTGQLIEQISKYLMGMGGAPEGYAGSEAQYLQGGPLAQAYYGKTLAGVQDPYAAYESQLRPALQQAEDYINRQAQGRGLIRSGIPIEQMGRAGVELAIKEAQDRMRFRSEELARGGELSQYGRGLEQQNLMNLSNLYNTQQTMGQTSLGRQAGAAQAAGQYWAYPAQAELGSIYGKEAALWALPGQMLGAGGKALSAPKTTVNYPG